jgi:hypothetical protein
MNYKNKKDDKEPGSSRRTKSKVIPHSTERPNLPKMASSPCRKDALMTAQGGLHACKPPIADVAVSENNSLSLAPSLVNMGMNEFEKVGLKENLFYFRKHSRKVLLSKGVKTS